MTAAPDGSSDEFESVDLGRYRLCTELAAGGMASVFLASTGADGGFSKVVALKRIHAHLARDPRFVDMFLDEARVASRITHPNVCSVFDFGAVEGTYFIAMEYLMGETFSSVHRGLRDRERKDHVAHLAEIFAQAAEGLHAAHELRGDDGELLGVVHRDVSPQNLFLTYDGCVKVVDFGVARCEGRIQHTEPGTIKGKLAYIPPEQVRCQEVDRRSDIWSLGVTLWEMLTGKSLFRRGNDIETLQAVASAPVAAPSTLVAGIPPALDAIVLKALARDVDQRWQTAREMSRALRDFARAEGARVGQVELEEWMLELFPAQRRQKQAMVQAARESSAVRSRPGAGLTPVSASRRPNSKVSGTHARASRSIDVPIDDQGEPLLLDADVPAGAMAAGTTVERPQPVLPPVVIGAGARAHAPGSFWAGMAVAGVIAIALGGWAVALLRAPAAPESSTPTVASAERATDVERDERAEIVAEPTLAAAMPPSAPSAPPEEPRAASRPVRARASAAPVRASARARRDEEVRTPEPSEAVEAPASEAAAGAPPTAEPAPPAEARAPEVTSPSPTASAPSSGAAAAPASASEPARPRSAAVPPTPPPPTPPPSLEATVSIEGLRMGGSIPMSAVRQAIDRLEGEYAQCYRGAAQRARRDGAGSVDVRLTLDEMGLPRRVSATGGPLPGVASCVEGVTSRLRSRLRPDTGTVDVSFGVRFSPRPGAPR